MTIDRTETDTHTHTHTDTGAAFATETFLCGPRRSPRQMLAEQRYDGHESLHDDAMAERLGFAAGPIEGPTHFSQFAPLLAGMWGRAWFERGCLSAHYRNMVVEGEQVRAFVAHSAADSGSDGGPLRIWAEKHDGVEVLVGTASLEPEAGPDAGLPRPATEIEERLAALRPPGPLVILRDLRVGMRGRAPEPVRIEFDQHMGDLYPFTLRQKLEGITEPSPWYEEEGGRSSPWGRAIVPLEMVSVLMQYTSRAAGFPVRGPAIGLFAGQQIRMLRGPVFVGRQYRIEREIVALSESRRTESSWIRSTLIDADSELAVAEMILNSATLKHSYEPYERELAELRCAAGETS